MKKTLGFFLLNFKIITAEKIAFVWSVLLPAFIAIVHQQNVLRSLSGFREWVLYLCWFWVFIIISCFVYGVGLQLARLRESGMLKTYTMLSGGKYPIVFGTILSQIVFCLVSLFIFTFIITFLNGMMGARFFILPVILLFISLPFGLFILFLPNLPFQYGNFSVIVNILIYLLLWLAYDSGNGSLAALFNPFRLFYELALFIGGLLRIHEPFAFRPEYAIVLGIYLLIGFFSLKKLNLLSVVQR